MIFDYIVNKCYKFILFLLYYLFISVIVGLIFMLINPLLCLLISAIFKAEVIDNIVEKELIVNILSLALFHYLFVSLLCLLNSKHHLHDKFREWVKEKIHIAPVTFKEYLNKIFILSMIWIYSSKIIFDGIDNLFQAMTIYFILFTIFNSETKKNY